jgi:hypothetical protein
MRNRQVFWRSVNVLHFHGQWVGWQHQSILAWNLEDVMWWVSRRSGVITTETHPSTSSRSVQQCRKEHPRFIYGNKIRKYKKNPFRRKSEVETQSQKLWPDFLFIPPSSSTTSPCMDGCYYHSLALFIYLFITWWTIEESGFDSRQG